MRLVADKTNAALRDELDIGDFAALGREVSAELGLIDGRRQVLDENP